jgi:hypothetical protein
MSDDNNPYSPPQANIADHQMFGGEKRKLFSPTQGGFGAFLFGPLTGLYILQANFSAMDEHVKRTNTFIYGAIAILLFTLLAPFIPEQVPAFLFGIIYMVPTRVIMENYQHNKEYISHSDRYVFQSNWHVFGMGVLGIVAYLFVLIAVMIFYSVLGVIEPLW